MGELADNYDLWARHESEREQLLAKLPKCDYCGEAITEDYFYIIGETFICIPCLNREHRQYTDDYANV